MSRGWIGALSVLVVVGCAGGDDPARELAPGPATASAGATAGDADNDGDGDDDDDAPAGDDDDDDDDGFPGGDDDDDDVPSGDDDDDDDDDVPSGDDDDDDDDPAPDDDDDDDAPSEPAAIVYLNFDGATLSSGGGDDDARVDQTLIPDLAGTWEGVGAELAQAVLGRVEAALAPYAIEVTDARPAAGDYTMVVVSSSPAPFPGAAGLSGNDCGDLNPNNIALVFEAATEMGEIATANTVLFQLGVTYGLNPSSDDGDAMFGQVVLDALGYADECLPMAGTPICESMADACPGGEQSSHEELVARFGPA